MASPIYTLSHTGLLRSLYRNLLRGLFKTEKLPIELCPDIEIDRSIKSELEKAALDPTYYRGLLVSELRYHIKERARVRIRSSVGLYVSLSRAECLIESLKELQKDPLQPLLWHQVIKFLIQLRDDQFKQQKWKDFYLRNQRKIDEQRRKQLPIRVLRRLNSKTSETKRERQFKSLKANGKFKELKKALKVSDEDEGFVVRNYLKRLQLEGRIPNPYKLPYISESLTLQSVNLPDPRKLQPGSTKASVLKQAYDHDYIKAIIEPELEYLINQSFLHEITEEISIKGPKKARIRGTNAGAMTAYFLGPPHDDYHTMKAIALDIKKLTRLFKLKHVWNMKSTDKVAIAHEKSVGDGFAVKGSGGYSDDEVICTREFYQKLADAEADWEALMNEVRTSKHVGKLPSFEKKRQQLRNQWRQSLEIASESINLELKNVCDKYKLLGAIFARQKEVQNALNAQFEERAVRYSDLLQALKDDNVFMHSELVNFKHPVEQGYFEALEVDYARSSKSKRGISVVERLGMGKNLGDYLAFFKFRFFQIGRRYRERFRF